MSCNSCGDMERGDQQEVGSPAHALPEAVEPPPGERNHGDDSDHQQHAAGNDIDDLKGLVPGEEVVWLHCQSMSQMFPHIRS